MVNSLLCFGSAAGFSSSNAFRHISKIQTAADYCTDTTLKVDSPGANSLIKRKQGTLDGDEGLKDVSSVIVTSAILGNSSSLKKTDEESFMDTGLNFQLHLGNKNTPNPKKPSLDTPKALETGTICDLQLSLSMGPSISVLTNTVPASTIHQNSLEAPATIAAMQTVDDGSTSSHWKPGGALIPSSYASEPNTGTLKQMIVTKVDLLPGIPDLSLTILPTPKRTVTCTSGLTNTPQRRTSTKTCQFQGCGKGARGASGLCIAHGGGRRCQREGCHKGAEGRTIYCKAHGGGRRCQFLGCTKSAEGHTDFCIAHGGGRRCSQEGCPRAARGKSGLCIRHGGGKRCQKENCMKSAEGYSGLCISHGGGRRCQFPACSKGAQGSTMFCKAHGGGKRCTALGCTKGAEGSTPFCKGHGGGKRCLFQGSGVCPKSVHGGTHFCVAHGGGKRCAILECTRSARGRTNFCVRHGGGKRCKFEGCCKSAQGRTDFCKAHGGGKLYSWGQMGSDVGAGGTPCDRFARGKTGLCAAHSDHRVHGEGTLELVASQNLLASKAEKMEEVVPKNVFALVGNDSKSAVGRSGFNPQFMLPVIPPLSSLVSLPEGRVHGGSLMAMLTSGACQVSHTGYKAVGNSSEKRAEYMIPCNWM